MTNCTLNCSDGTDDGVNLDADYVMRIIYLIIGVLGIIGNTLVVGVLLHFKFTRTNHTNTFIINQSFIDGLASFFIVLSTFIRDVSAIKDSLARELFCRLWLTNLPIWATFMSSTYNMVAVTFQRYWALVHPISYKHFFTRKKALAIITIVWIIGPAYNAAYMIPTAGMVNGECTVYSVWPNHATQTAVGFLTVALQYFIPLGLIIFAYTHIAITLSKAGAKRDRHKSHGGKNGSNIMKHAHRNVIKTLAVVSACFVFCWSWNQIYYTMYNCGFDTDFNSIFYHFTVIMAFGNCCINPLIYAMKYEQFQRGICILTGCNKIKIKNDVPCFTTITSVDEDYDGEDVTQNGSKNAEGNKETTNKHIDIQQQATTGKQDIEYHNMEHEETMISIISDKIFYQTYL